MTLVTTPGDPLADSYVSVAEADSYHEGRGNAAWVALDASAKEAALRYATQYADSRYRYRGTIADTEQALGWPRKNARDDEGRELSGIPSKLQAAVCELALVHANAALNAAQAPRVLRERVEGAVEIEYADEAVRRPYPVVDALLQGLVRGGGHNVKVARG